MKTVFVLKKNSISLKKDAFTLMEVLFSVVILSSCLMILSKLTFNALNRSDTSHKTIQHLQKVKSELVQSLRTLFDVEEKKENSTKYQIVKTTNKINKKSSLKDFSGKINILKVESFFESGKYKESVALVGFAQKKPEDKA
jgi:prepilin-type N-terminal cleavage/methylation domain-containing protein